MHSFEANQLADKLQAKVHDQCPSLSDCSGRNKEEVLRLSLQLKVTVMARSSHGACSRVRIPTPQKLGELKHLMDE